MDNIIVPSPSQYVPHRTVEKIAIECNKLYRRVFSNPNGYPVDVEVFIDQHFQISILLDYLEEPEYTTLFAQFSNDENEGERITINKKYEALFNSRPEILRSTFGHELAHYVLRHHDLLHPVNETPSLFSDHEIKRRNLHRHSWKQYGLTEDDIAKLVKYAIYSDTARQLIAKLEDRLEPDWIFRQAEHFSMCLLIPQDKLFEIVEGGINFNGWPPIYDLANRFGVSPSMMRVRLEKLGLIEIGADGKPRNGSKSKQPSLFTS